MKRIREREIGHRRTGVVEEEGGIGGEDERMQVLQIPAGGRGFPLVPHNSRKFPMVVGKRIWARVPSIERF